MTRERYYEILEEKQIHIFDAELKYEEMTEEQLLEVLDKITEINDRSLRNAEEW